MRVSVTAWVGLDGVTVNSDASLGDDVAGEAVLQADGRAAELALERFGVELGVSASMRSSNAGKRSVGRPGGGPASTPAYPSAGAAK